MSAFVYVYVDDVDATHCRAIRGGATSLEELRVPGVERERNSIEAGGGSVGGFGRARDELELMPGLLPVVASSAAAAAREREVIWTHRPGDIGDRQLA